MNQAYQPYIDDEIDLREIVLTLLRGWKIILLLTVLFGAAAYGYSKLQTPVYEASAVIYLDAEALAQLPDPINLLYSDAVRQQVADIHNLPVESLPALTNYENFKPQGSLSAVTISAFDDEDGTIYRITVQSERAQEAADLANIWAEVGLARIQSLMDKYLERHVMDEVALAEANRALVYYLDEQGLSEWTWVDLAMLTGYGTQPTVLLKDGENNPAQTGIPASLDAENLPSISSQQHLEILQLMYAKSAAEHNYYLSRAIAEKIRYQLEVSPSRLMNAAALPEDPISSKTILNTALGLVAGGMLGVFWVFAAAWWRNSEDAADK